MNSITIYLLWIAALITSTQGSLLRGIPMKKIIQDVEQHSHSSTHFDCEAYDLDGMIPPDQPQMENHQWICVLKAYTEDDLVKTFFFDDDIEERFSADLPELGHPTMSVPWSAVTGTSIDTSHEGISVNKDKSNRRRLAPRMGTQKVLIVRVIGTDQAPSYWKADIHDNFFSDENNLHTRFKECSKGRLNLIPATGPQVNKGVINININMAVTAKHYMTVSDAATNELNKIVGLDYKTKIFVMPDGVDFRGGAAWAGLYGDTIWIRNVFSPYPMVQVHEYGHLLGLHHSGKGSSTYSDSTGYMGNQLPWNDQGAFTCFNPAKMWYLQWFQWRHTTIKPVQNPFNGEIVCLDDVVKDNTNGEKMIIKIEGDLNEFFIMFNKAKGINRGAVGYRDRIVITKQNGESGISYAMAGLLDGEEWTYPNFAGTGKKLVVKNCMRKQTFGADTSKILIYIEGLNGQTCDDKNLYPSQSPSTSPSQPISNNNGANPTNNNKNQPSCQSIAGWRDSAGDGCDWYSENDHCSYFGYSSGTGEFSRMNANQACCACGGGSTSITSSPVVSPTFSPSIRSSESPSTSSISESGCTDVPGWYDSGGDAFTCEWYAKSKNNCKYFGHLFERDNLTANKACCVCGERLNSINV